MGEKGGMLMSEREMDNTLPSDTTARQNATERICYKSYSDVVIEGVVPVVPVGGQWMIKWEKTMKEMLGRSHLSLGGGSEDVKRRDVQRHDGRRRD